MIVLGCTLVGLAIAWVGVEVVGNLKLTIFQPFRLATVARGLSLVFVAGHIMRLWNRGDAQGRTRAALIGTGLTGDWSLVVVTLFECIMWFIDRHAARFPSWRKVGGWCGAGFLACGLWFLAKHDTESGHIPLLAVSFISIAFGGWFAGRLRLHGTRQLALRTILCWIVPAASCAANLIPEGTLHGRASRSLRLALVKHCRFAEIPVDDVERLALWCRENTPKSARFIGPPGQKNFRLWSHRGLAFNRAGSPYHAAGLSDWAARFRDHVAFEGSNAELVQAYLSDRHGLESRYDLATAGELTALAIRQEADHVLARSGLDEDSGACLLAIRVEGPYAIYRVQPVASRAGPTSKSDGDLQRVSSAPRWTNPVPLPR